MQRFLIALKWVLLIGLPAWQVAMALGCIHDSKVNSSDIILLSCAGVFFATAGLMLAVNLLRSKITEAWIAISMGSALAPVVLLGMFHIALAEAPDEGWLVLIFGVPVVLAHLLLYHLAAHLVPKRNLRWIALSILIPSIVVPISFYLTNGAEEIFVRDPYEPRMIFEQVRPFDNTLYVRPAAIFMAFFLSMLFAIRAMRSDERHG